MVLERGLDSSPHTHLQPGIPMYHLHEHAMSRAWALLQTKPEGGVRNVPCIQQPFPMGKVRQARPRQQEVNLWWRLNDGAGERVKCGEVASKGGGEALDFTLASKPDAPPSIV